MRTVAPRINTPRLGGQGLVGSLNTEWEHLSQDATLLLHLRHWYGDPSLTGPQSVLDSLRACRTADGQDRILLPLLRAAVAGGPGSQLAARTVVQTMLPKAIRIARSQLRPQYDWEETVSLTVGALYEVVRTYPVHRRGRRVAANLALDTLRLTRRLIGHDPTAVPLDPDSAAGLSAASDPCPASQAELTLLLARAGEYRLLTEDEPMHAAGWDARAELVELLVWALESGALDVEDARLITGYYRDRPASHPVAPRPSARDGARQRQRRSRAVRRLAVAASDRFATAK
ncbi:hypothetical protein [Streptomyces drozdowiczii]|uniref:Uncharacterized protein n=1 Tax=Streptomyces drozdowiczii TaxID=202862 RepID=A0ABY6PUB3_9ACTN|nr:hypothetical protein [Streptomyces drozdowiczii]MCX0244605.1 hypothetical protein [Streptomyces drozdowiczii]UZK55647.1 hypothetical protein NEH16_17305 [Streptomyces drozdowiczii]